MAQEMSYLEELARERDSLDACFVHAQKLLLREISRVKDSMGSSLEFDEVADDDSTRNITEDGVVALREHVIIPVKDFPEINFVDKLLGQGGEPLKKLEARTETKMSVLGRGSMMDEEKEEQLRESNDKKYAHLQQPLHVLIEVEGNGLEAYDRLSGGLVAIKRYLKHIYHDHDDATWEATP